jgi:superfamily II DNA or RNA helicase
MSHYPSIEDDEFYNEINKIYKQYKIPKNELSIDEYCKPKEFTLQEPQKFLSNYINPKTPYKSILIYHRIGAGKTCAAIQIAEKWKNSKRIVFVLPASLKGNFKNELRSLCGGNNYMTPQERIKLADYQPGDDEYIKIMKKSDERIEKYYDIYSYNKFIERIKEGTMKLNNAILFIDEIQNMVSETGTYYKELHGLIHNSSKNLRIVLLSATPMFDRPVEIALTINLLNPVTPLPTGREFEKMFIGEKIKQDKTFYYVKNMDIFKNMIKGYVSYYRGAPAFTFPTMTIKYVECEMSTFQYSVYKQFLKNENINSFDTIPSKEEIMNAVDLSNNFYIGARFISNIVYPNGKINDYGLDSLTDKKIKNNLAKFSCKLDKIMTNIKRARGKIFVYSGFKEFAGIKTIVKVLEAFGYKNYVKHGVGYKRFAVWSGDQSIEMKDEIREIYNRLDNIEGHKIKLIIGSPSIKEGVSLKAVRYVHVLEPYWNHSRLEQIVGRASRFCSHIMLPEEERNVKVYVYIATHPAQPTTVDQYIKKLSDTKNKIIRQFENAIKEAAIDCRLNKNANETENNEIKCL